MKVNKPMTINEYFKLDKKEKVLIGKVKYNSDGKTYNFLISEKINPDDLKVGQVVLVKTRSGYDFNKEVYKSGILQELSLEEVTEKAKQLNEEVEEKKDQLEIDEEKFAELKEKYYDYENFNNQLINFQSEQDYIIKELTSKIEDSVNITEKVTYHMQLMNKQSKKLLKMLAIPMMVPGARSAKAVAAGAIAYMMFARKLMKPRLKERKYRIVEVTDYSKEIEGNITKIEEATTMISKTSSKLEEMISEIEKDFKDYINDLPECRELLENLNKLLDSMKAKEEELQRTKEQQQQLLEQNNQKVKTLPKTEEM